MSGQAGVGSLWGIGVSAEVLPCRDLLLLLCLEFCAQSEEGATGQECPRDPAEVAGQSSTSCEQVAVSAGTPARESAVLPNSPQGPGSHRLTEREETAEFPAAESQRRAMSAASVMCP